MALGQHRIEYEVLEGWDRLPEGWSYVEVAGVAAALRAIVAVGHGRTPSPVASSLSASLPRPRRMRLLTVPSGRSSITATSL